MELDAFYPCYLQKDALNFVLYNFRKHYPTSHIELVCDGGMDFTEEALKYNCNYTYKEKNPSWRIQGFENPKYLLEWCKRFFGSVSNFKNNFFIKLEDDVYILKKTNELDLKFDINGYNPNEKLPISIIENILKYNSYCSNFSFGGCGGSIFKTSFFKNMYSSFNEMEKDVLEFCSISPKNMWVDDVYISYLCYKKKGTIGNYNGFCELWYKDAEDRLNSNNVEVLHKYKNYYK